MTPPKPEILCGIHSVEEALNANRRTFYEIYCSRPAPDPIAAATRQRGIPVVRKTPEELRPIAGTDQHQHIAAKVSPFSPADFAGMVKKGFAETARPLFMIVDSVEDPRNLGSLIRTAVCAGVSGVVVPRDRCAPLSPTVSRASAGAMEHCPISRVANLVNAIKTLKKHGAWITGLDGKGRLTIYETDLDGPHAIVVGGENTGIRRLVAQNCDNLCRIPQFGPVNSLNASVAGAVAIYEALRQRIEK